MGRSICIVGNGLGRALKPENYELKTALNKVWNDTGCLSRAHKLLILGAISDTNNQKPPCSEDQLDNLHWAIVATEFLKGFENRGKSWLTDEAKEIPVAFKKYIHAVAWYFHELKYPLPEAFANNLTKFILQTKSHVATLNYDTLLYNLFVKKMVFNGFDGSLVDGYLNAGFKDSNLDRYNGKNFGWYLHLHGSALFSGKHKIMGPDRSCPQLNEENHIVLTHVAHKPYIIESSFVLRSYWKRLNVALSESEKIILFGYSGLDDHLNDRIKSGGDFKEIYIIEWSGSGEEIERKKFWKDKLSNDVKLIHKQCILDYNFMDLIN